MFIWEMISGSTSKAVERATQRRRKKSVQGVLLRSLLQALGARFCRDLCMQNVPEVSTERHWLGVACRGGSSPILTSNLWGQVHPRCQRSQKETAEGSFRQHKVRDSCYWQGG